MSLRQFNQYDMLNCLFLEYTTTLMKKDLKQLVVYSQSVLEMFKKKTKITDVFFPPQLQPVHKRKMAPVTLS